MRPNDKAAIITGGSLHPQNAQNRLRLTPQAVSFQFCSRYRTADAAMTLAP